MNTLPAFARSAERELIDSRAAPLVPVEGYALRPPPDAFANIEVLTPVLEQANNTDTVFDVTAFYSRRKAGLSAAAEEALTAFNLTAYEAAIAAGGLLLYFQGPLLETTAKVPPSPELGLDFVPNCMSFCIWQSRSQATIGAGIPEHKSAAARVQEWYDCFAIKKYKLQLQATTEAAGRLVFSAYALEAASPYK